MQTQDQGLQEKLIGIWALLDERGRRLIAANEARSLGYGGVCAVHRACGMSRVTITKGLHEIAEGVPLPEGRIRRSGAGRKRITKRDPGLLSALDRLIEPGTRGDPETPLRWICKSTRTLATELAREHHPVCAVKVGQLLHDQHFSLQSNRKTEEGANHTDRDAQFRYINEQVTTALKEGLPVISVDTKKKELIGNYVNTGRQCGKSRCNSLQTTPACPSPCATFRPVRANGTKSSTASSPSSPPTGAANRCATTRRSSI